MAVDREIFIGRTQQLADLMDVAAKVQAGEPWVVLVDGVSGVGKTALVRQFVRQLDRFWVLSAAADRHEADLPGGVLGQLLARVRAERRQPYPLLLLGNLQGTTPFAAGGQLIGLLSDLEEQHPVLIVVDDAHWIDEFSLQTLLFVLRRLWTDPVMVVLTVRSGEQDQREAELRSFVMGYERAVHVRLGGLNRSEIARLAAAMQGEEVANEAVLDRLLARTGGRALYVRAVLSEVQLYQLARSEAMLAPSSMVALIHRSLATLAPESRALVEALAVLDAQVPLHIAAALAGLTDHEAATRALGPLLRADLVRWRPEDVATPVTVRHALQRDAIYAQLSPQRRQQLHARAAALVSGAAVWVHRVAAAAGMTNPSLADELDSVAREESARGQHALAARHWLFAADLTTSRTDCERRLVLAYFELQSAGQISRMIELRARLEACGPGILRDIALTGAASSAGRAEALQFAYRAWQAALAHPNPRELARYFSYNIPAVFLVWGDAQTAREASRWVLDLRTLDGEPLSGTRGVLAWATLVLDGPRAALRTITEQTAADGFDPGPHNVQLIAVRGSLKVLDGALSAGLTDLHTALRYSREGCPIMIGRRLWAFARWACFLTGRWDEARLSVVDTDAVRQRLSWYDYPYEHLSRIWVQVARGEWDRARQELDLIRQSTQQHPSGGEHLCTSIGRALVAQARGDRREMYEALAPLRGSPATSYDHVQTSRWWLPLLAEAEIGTGRFDAAAETLDRIGDVDDIGYLYLQTARLRGWLAERQDDPDRALEVYRVAAESAVMRDAAPFYRALLNLTHGRLLRTTRQRRRAIEHLRSAADSLAALGAAPALRECTDELARCGLHAPRQRTKYTTKLTDREREIAHLVSQGRTNREISAELFVSAKTVEYHLANVYLKLNISGRRELRDLMQRAATA